MSRLSLRRLLSVTVTAALAFALLPAGTATAAEPRDISDACPEGDVPDPGFSDDNGNFAEDAIHCIVWYGIAEGTSSSTYSPGNLVGRGAMAKFIANLLTVGGVTLPSDPEDAFEDDDDSPFEPFINQLAELGVVKGVTETEYRPAAQVRRDQMASFLARAFEEITGEPLPAGEDAFSDDDGNEAHEDNINRVAAAGIAAGTGNGEYSPKNPVKRDQMALFIARELDLLVEEGFVAVPRGDGVNRTALDVPELLFVEKASETQVRFVFDEDLNQTVATGSFSVFSFGAERTAATATMRETTDTIIATFPAEALQQATLAAVAAGAVQDADGNLSPEGHAPLDEVEVHDGVTVAPDLLTVAPRANEATFGFDEAAFALNDEGYHLVLTDGTVKNSSAVSSGSGTSTHVVTFTLTAEEAGQVAFGYVDAATVSDQEGDGNPANGVEGNPNVLQIVDVSSTGLTDLPDLLEVEILDARRVRYRFDENVTRVNNQLGQAQGAFRIYRLDGSAVAASSAEQASNNPSTFIATFPEGAITELTTGANVAAGTVRGQATQSNPDRRNPAQELGFEFDVPGGDTAGPELESAAITERTTDDGAQRIVRFLFDEPVDAIVDGARFKVYAKDGSNRSFVAASQFPPRDASCSVSTENRNLVECVVPEGQADLYAFLADAVVGAVETGAASSNGGFRNAPAAAVLSGSVG